MPSITINLTAEQLQELYRNEALVVTLSGRPSAATPHKSPAPAPQEGSLFDLFRELTQKYAESGNLRTAETYRTAYNKFRRFRMGHDLPPAELTADVVESYQGFLRSYNLTMNTVSFYMRILRSVYRKAVERQLTADYAPFHHAYTGQAKTVKRALTLRDIRRIKTVKVESRAHQFARDLFLFSFYTRGMSFVDIAYLRKSDVHDGMIFYKRRKTGQMLCIKWERSMQEIVNRYPNPHTPYLLPIITKEDGTERSQYRNCQGRVNARLRDIARKLRMKQKLTMYCARHSWATTAKDMKVPLDTISRAMGHTNLHTTEIYLKSIESNAIDKANSKIISLV